MSRWIGVLAALAVMAGAFAISTGARVATPCTINGSPVSARLPVCVGGVAGGGEKPGTVSNVQIVLASMNHTVLPAVMVTSTIPKGAKVLSSARPYKLVNGRPTWIIRRVAPNLVTGFRFKMRSPLTGKPGSRWCVVFKANVVGQKAISKSQASCVTVPPAA